MRTIKNIGSSGVSFVIISIFVAFVFGCASPTKVTDLVPQSFLPGVNVHKMEGSVNVRTMVPKGTTNPTYVSMDVNEWIDSKKLKEAIELSITQQGVFSEVSQGQTDYILEVWVDKIQNMLEITGEGFIFDFTSVWRLTKTKDNKIIACDFVKGHGAARGLASRAYPPSISAATIDMIQKGLFSISDQSQSHLTAISSAEKRPSISMTDK